MTEGGTEKKQEPKKTTPLTRREFLKLTGLVGGGAVLAGLLPKREQARASNETDPHSFEGLFDLSTGITVIINKEGVLQRVVLPPEGEEGWKASVPWQGKDPRKPDAPWGNVRITTSDGRDVRKDLKYSQTTQISPSQEKGEKDFDPLALEGVFDLKTGTTLLVDEHGALKGVVLPPPYQEGLADKEWHVSVPWTGQGKKLDAPWGNFRIETPDGRKTRTELKYTQSLMLTNLTK